MKDVKELVVLLMVILYDVFLIAGTAYLVQEHNWSMWTFLLTMCFFMTARTKDEKDPVQ